MICRGIKFLLDFCGSVILLESPFTRVNMTSSNGATKKQRTFQRAPGDGHGWEKKETNSKAGQRKLIEQEVRSKRIMPS